MSTKKMRVEAYIVVDDGVIGVALHGFPFQGVLYEGSAHVAHQEMIEAALLAEAAGGPERVLAGLARAHARTLVGKFRRHAYGLPVAGDLPPPGEPMLDAPPPTVPPGPTAFVMTTAAPRTQENFERFVQQAAAAAWRAAGNAAKGEPR